MPVKILAGAAEGGAYGGALVAGVGEGIWEKLDDVDVLETKEMIQPNPDTKEAYDKAFKIYEKLYFDLYDTFKMAAE